MKRRPVSREQKAANKEFTKRGKLLSTLAEAVAKFKATQPPALSHYNSGPVYTAQIGVHTTRGTLDGFTPTGLVLQCLEYDDMSYFVRFGQLTTDSLARLIALLS